MFVAVSGNSQSLPADVLNARRILEAGSAASKFGERHGKAPADSSPIEFGHSDVSVNQMNNWELQAHQYSTQMDVQASLLSRLLSGESKLAHYGVVQEAKRFCVVTTKDSLELHYGTAVRLSVVVLSAKLDVSLTIPNIAAKTQISNTTAKIALSVDGFIGPLGDMLPAPDSLNVENLSLYTSAFQRIQAHVFGPKGQQHLSSAFLGYNAVEPSTD